jgi:hypothetical protein
MDRLTGCERSNRDDGEENAKTSWPQSRLAAHSANRRFDSHDIYLRPAQAAGIFVFQTLAIAGLLPIGALIISGNPIAFGLLSIAFITNFVVYFLRPYYPWPYNPHLLAGAWLIIAATLGIVVARAVFGSGRIT